MLNMNEVRRIVVKVGSSTLTYDNGKPNIRRIERLVRTISDLQNRGFEMVLVSSGAVAVGTAKLGLAERPKELSVKQAAAAVGQGELMFLYDKFFGEYDVVVSQLLFTYDALENPDNKEHLTNTFNQLLEYGSIPVVNENDSVSIEELLNGDNDCLSATVAELIGADMLILLTDTDGLYDGNPSENPEARLIDIVEEITEEIEAFAGGAGKRGTGGFMTKVKAAKIATSAGIPVVVMNGADPKKIYDVLNGENVGTKFLS